MEVVVNVAAWYYEDKKNGENPLKGKGLIGINTTRNALVKCFGARPIGEITKEDIKQGLVKNWDTQASRADYLREESPSHL